MHIGAHIKFGGILNAHLGEFSTQTQVHLNALLGAVLMHCTSRCRFKGHLDAILVHILMQFNAQLGAVLMHVWSQFLVQILMQFNAYIWVIFTAKYFPLHPRIREMKS